MVALEPVHRGLHRVGIEPASHRASGLAAHDQPGLRQHVEVLHDCGQRYRERTRQLAHREILMLAQPRDQRAPGRVGKRPEGPVEIRLILNHVVKYRSVPVRVN